MIKSILNMMEPEHYESMCERVIKMNTGIEDFVKQEMLNHKDAYDPVTGHRKTEYQSPNGNDYLVASIIASDESRVNCEFILPEKDDSESMILYVHGAAFQRRVNDINLKTADRLCTMTGQGVCVPDYRVGIEYTYDQMISDIVDSYRYLIKNNGYKPENITVLADSSGSITALQAIKELYKWSLPAPRNIILWSPQADDLDDEKIQMGKMTDIAMRPNDLFKVGQHIFRDEMGKGKSVEELFPIYGDYSNLKDSRILIQVGADEMLLEDAYQLHDLFSKICSCTFEVYEDMYHNFQTYFSICEMAKVCWQSTVKFIKEGEICNV